MYPATDVEVPERLKRMDGLRKKKPVLFVTVNVIDLVLRVMEKVK